MHFDTKASSYESSAQVQALMAAWLDEWVEPAWPRACRVLELGAGTGLLSRRLLTRAPFHAQDLSPSMVQTLSGRHPELACSQGDAFVLQDGAWDRLYSASMLQWAECPSRVMRNWIRAMAPGGRMLHGLYVAPSLPELAALAPGTVPLHWRRPETWVHAAEAAGFLVPRWETRTVELRHPSAHAFLRGLHDTGVHSTHAIFGAGRLRRLLREYTERHPTPCGGVVSTWTLLRLEALNPKGVTS